MIPHLYDLAPDGTGMLCLQGITGDMVVLEFGCFLAGRALDAGSQRQSAAVLGATMLMADEDDDDSKGIDEEEQAEADAAAEEDEASASDRHATDAGRGRCICLDLCTCRGPQTPISHEIRRIARQQGCAAVRR